MRIVPLGGLGEIGRNMNVVEYNGHILLIDCGVLFPEEEQPGVDLILPDFSYIKGKLDQVDALVLTHGHEDHIGGVPYLLKLRPDIPLIGSKLTLGFVDAKYEEHHLRPTEVEVKGLPGLVPPRSGSTKSPSASAAKAVTKSTTPAQQGRTHPAVHNGHRAQRGLLLVQARGRCGPSAQNAGIAIARQMWCRYRRGSGRQSCYKSRYIRNFLDSTAILNRRNPRSVIRLLLIVG